MTLGDRTAFDSPIVRRSPLRRLHLRAGASMNEMDAGGAPRVYVSEAEDLKVAARLGLVDLCLQPRAGFKGAGSVDYLRQFMTEFPTGPNWARYDSRGLLISQLSFDEYLLLDTAEVPLSAVREVSDQWSLEGAPNCYEVPRLDSHGCLGIMGSYARQVLSSLVSVDLRAQTFNNLQIAQTMLNELGVILIRQDFGSVPNFYLFTDISAIEYLWTVLLDAMRHTGGAPIGLDAFHSLREEAR